MNQPFVDAMLGPTKDHLPLHIMSQLCSSPWPPEPQQADSIAFLSDQGLNGNAKKSLFGKSELENLGYWVTSKGIQPMPKKVQDILALQPQTIITQGFYTWIP